MTAYLHSKNLATGGVEVLTKVEADAATGNITTQGVLEGSSVKTGTTTLSASRLDPGTGTFDIGTSLGPGAGINGNSIAITGSLGGMAANPLVAGTGGDFTGKGGRGGIGDGDQLGGDGGDTYIEGGIAGASGGAGAGTSGIVYIGMNDTSEVIVGSTSLKWNADGGGNIGESVDNRPDSIWAKTLIKAGASTALKADRLSITGAGSDPGTLVAGDIWYRTDLGKFKFRNATVAVELLDASTAIANPSTKNSGDLLQYDGATWNAKGGSGSTRLAGFAVTGNVNLNGQLLLDGGSGQNILWSTDGGGDVGGVSAQRPNNLYVKTLLQVAGFTAVTYDTSGSIALNSVKEVTLASTDTVTASYTWAANELLNSSAIEFDIVLGSNNNAQTYGAQLQYWNGSSWGGMFAVTSISSSNGSVICYKIRFMMSPITNTRAMHWGFGSTGSTSIIQDTSSPGSSTFLATADRGLRLVLRKTSDTYTGYASVIMRELRGG